MMKRRSRNSARYYLADVPGFAWTADYYFNHVLHYVLAIVLLAILGWRLPRILTRKSWTAMDVIVGLCWAGIIMTGIIRVMKNQPESYFSPTLVMWVDWSHLGFVMLLGAADDDQRVQSREAERQCAAASGVGLGVLAV